MWRTTRRQSNPWVPRSRQPDARQLPLSRRTTQAGDLPHKASVLRANKLSGLRTPPSGPGIPVNRVTRSPPAAVRHPMFNDGTPNQTARAHLARTELRKAGRADKTTRTAGLRRPLRRAETPARSQQFFVFGRASTYKITITTRQSAVRHPQSAQFCAGGQISHTDAGFADVVGKLSRAT